MYINMIALDLKDVLYYPELRTCLMHPDLKDSPLESAKEELYKQNLIAIFLLHISEQKNFAVKLIMIMILILQITIMP